MVSAKDICDLFACGAKILRGRPPRWALFTELQRSSMNKLHIGCAAAQIPIIECLHPTPASSASAFYDDILRTPFRRAGRVSFFLEQHYKFRMVRQMKPLLKRNPQNRHLLFDTGRPTQNFCAILRKNFCWSEFFGSTVLKKFAPTFRGARLTNFLCPKSPF